MADRHTKAVLPTVGATLTAIAGSVWPGPGHVPMQAPDGAYPRGGRAQPGNPGIPSSDRSSLIRWGPDATGASARPLAMVPRAGSCYSARVFLTQACAVSDLVGPDTVPLAS
jgi:hypothetical protein